MNEIMHAILHRGNDSNFRKLLLGRKWADLLEDGTMDTTRWDAFEKRMQQEGKLTKAHYDFAQNVWDQLDDMKPGAQKAHRDAYGRYFTEVTANEFHTPFGMYRGGYVPAKVDSRIVKDMELKKLIEEGNLLGTEFAKIPQELGLRKGMGRGFYVLLMGLAVPAIVSEAIAQVFRGGPDDDDKDGSYLDDWLMAVLVYGPMKTVTAFVPGGSMVNSAVAKFNHNPADDKMSITPVMNSLDALASIPVDLWKAEQGKANAQKTIRDLATVISVTVGLPANIVAKPLGYMAGVEQGKTKPTSDLDLARGLITGTSSPPSKQK